MKKEDFSKIGDENDVKYYEYESDASRFLFFKLEQYETNGLKELFDVKKIITFEDILFDEDYKKLHKVYLGNGEWADCSEKQQGELNYEYDKRKDEEVGKGLDIWAKEWAEKDKKFEPIGWEIHYSHDKHQYALSVNGIRQIEEEDTAEKIAKRICKYGSAMDLVSLYAKRANKNNCYVTDREMECMQKILTAAIKEELNKKMIDYKYDSISKAKFDAYVLKYNIARTKIIPNMAKKWAAQKQQRARIQKAVERHEAIMDKIESKVSALFDRIDDMIEKRRMEKAKKKEQKRKIEQQKRDEHIEKTAKDLEK